MPEIPTPDASPATPLGGPRRPAARRPPGLLRRSAGMTRRWLKDTFARDQLVAGAKQLAWVAPLTVLIWVYAERAQQYTEIVRFSVTARSSNDRVHVTVADPPDAIVQAVLQGARSRIEDVQGRVGSQDPVVIHVPPTDTKSRTFTVAEILDADPRFRGLTWQNSPNSTPVRVEVKIDPIEEQTLSVQVRQKDREWLEAGGAVFTPPRVKVRMPKEVADIARSTSGGQLIAYADLTALREGPPGRKQTVSDVRVVVEGADGREEVRIEPGTVSAALTLREAEGRHTIDQLPVDTYVRGGVTNDYEVELEPATVFNVSVVGPAAVIDQLKRDGGAGVSAHVVVSPEDVENERPKKVTFILPPLVRLAPDTADRDEVRVTLRRKSAAPE